MEIIENYQRLCQDIAGAAVDAGRESDSVKLLVVSKTWDSQVIRPLVDIGHRAFGENRVQEAEEKASELPANLDWHLIGHLQKNKIRKALTLFSTIQTVDSHALARRIERVAHELALFPRVLLQVNLGEEPQKHGFTVNELREVMGDLLTLPRLEIAGLMAIPPFAEDAEETRGHFRALRELRDELEDTYAQPFPELSMGMTGDYRVAIEEGSTVVRVGSAIFGDREKVEDRFAPGG